MKTIVLKVAILLAPFGVAAVAMGAHLEALRDGVFNQEIESKFQTFVLPDTDVIIGGDSRGERQVVPSIIESRTGRKTSNIATAAGDLITLYNSLKRHGALQTDRALIVSTSIFQVNDGAIKPGYISTACTLNMTWPERINVYRSALPSLWRFLVKSQAGEERPIPMSGTRLQENGFFGVEGTLPLPVTILVGPQNTRHPWYQNLSLHGARWRVFEEALGRFGKSKLRIYLYLPPVSPAWRAYTTGTFIDKAEREFGTMLQAATRSHSNIRILDFYSEPDPRLGNDLYQDIQHVNRAGAAQFTEILIERIGNDLRAGRIQ